MPHTLLIPLVGPMQAWGSRSRFEDRDTHPEPTKSGVIGLLCAALGRGRNENIADLTALKMGVRTDQPGRPMTDYQTAQNVRTADGSLKETTLSTRHYLADARFLVGLEGEVLSFLRKLETALQNPVWALSLGRRSYPLDLPPYLPERCGGSLREEQTLKAALEREPWRRLRQVERPPERLRLSLEDAAGVNTLSDTPLHFGERRFGLRQVSITPLWGSRLSVEDHPCI